MLVEHTGRTPSIVLLLIIMAMFANSIISKWNSTVHGHTLFLNFFFLKINFNIHVKKKKKKKFIPQIFFLRIIFNILIFTSNQSLFIIF
jgi:hypothetical protein